MNEVISFIDSVNLISKYNHSDLNNSTCLCWETAGAVDLLIQQNILYIGGHPQ